MNLKEKHWRIKELVGVTGIKPDKLRDLFKDEPGVIVIPCKGKGKKTIRSIRLYPESVVRRLFSRFER